MMCHTTILLLLLVIAGKYISLVVDYPGLLQVISWGSIAIIPAIGSSIAIMTAFLLLSNLGAPVVEVATDALVAECGKKDQGRVFHHVSFNPLHGWHWL